MPEQIDRVKIKILLRTTGDTKFLKFVARREARNLKRFSKARGAREENIKIEHAVASSYFASKTARLF